MDIMFAMDLKLLDARSILSKCCIYMVLSRSAFYKIDGTILFVTFSNYYSFVGPVGSETMLIVIILQ